MRYIAITDVHACSRELEDLINAINPQEGDEFIGFSDIIDKGPNPGTTLRLVRKLAQSYPVHYVLGNHCYKNLKFKRKYEDDPHAAMKLGNASELLDNYNELTEDDWEFLYTGKFYHKIPTHNTLLVHAGICPSVRGLPTLKPYSDMSKKEVNTWSHLWYTRYVNDAGYMISLGQENKDSPFWTNVYDGRFGRVLYGHQPYKKAAEPIVLNNTVGFDLGCVYGNRLAAILLDSEDTEGYQVISVPAYEKYDEPGIYFGSQEEM